MHYQKEGVYCAVLSYVIMHYATAKAIVCAALPANTPQELILVRDKAPLLLLL
jgi:hypothetical protein